MLAHVYRNSYMEECSGRNANDEYSGTSFSQPESSDIPCLDEFIVQARAIVV